MLGQTTKTFRLQEFQYRFDHHEFCAYIADKRKGVYSYKKT